MRRLLTPLRRLAWGAAGLSGGGAVLLAGAIIIGDRRVSWQGRGLMLALRAYRLWSTHQPQDLAAVRRSQDAFGRGLATASQVRIEDLTVAGCPAAWALPAHATPDRAVLYLHGGGYDSGSLVSHRGLVTRIADAARVRTLALDYRLAPEHPFPAAVDDATGAYRWLLAQGYAPAHIVVAGDSAGGGLVAATLVALRDGDTPLPAGAALLSPWTDLSDPERTWERRASEDLLLTPDALHAGARDYLHGRDPRTPLASPRYADLRGLPPLLIQVGGDELLLDNTEAFAAHAQAAGVDTRLEVWPGLFHVWHMMASYLPEARQAIDRVGAFVRRRTGAA